MLRIGIDTGGTFTDLVALNAASGEISIVKVPSTPKQPADAPIAAIRQVQVAPDEVERIVMGTTIAINARLQKRGSTVLYIGTKGVEDVPIIARIDRKEAYNPGWPKPDSGIKRRHVYGIAERLDSKGNVLRGYHAARSWNGSAAGSRRWTRIRAEAGLGDSGQSTVFLHQPGARADRWRVSHEAVS